MKSIDRLSDCVLGAMFGAAGFLLGNAIFFKATWQLVAAPVVGGILGLVAAMKVLRDMKLSLAATWGDVRAHQAGKNAR